MSNGVGTAVADVSIETELDLLEEKIQQAAETIERLRMEKNELREECGRLRSERTETVERLSRILKKVDSLNAK